MEELGLDFIHRAVPKDKTQRNRVVEVSGQPYVPVLVDPENKKVLTDEEAIVTYIRTTYGSAKN